MDSKLHILLLKATSAFNKKVFGELADTGLTSGQPKVLDFLKNHNGCEQKEIASACDIETSTVTSLLLRMEESGLVERRMLNGNRRSHYVFLTDKGKKSQEVVSEVFHRLEELAFRDFTAQEQEDFLQKILLIYRNLAEEKAE